MWVRGAVKMVFVGFTNCDHGGDHAKVPFSLEKQHSKKVVSERVTTGCPRSVTKVLTL